jgi:hypothetical protein
MGWQQLPQRASCSFAPVTSPRCHFYRQQLRTAASACREESFHALCCRHRGQIYKPASILSF